VAARLSTLWKDAFQTRPVGRSRLSMWLDLESITFVRNAIRHRRAAEVVSKMVGFKPRHTFFTVGVSLYGGE
jgi:hypothetical protein